MAERVALVEAHQLVADALTAVLRLEGYDAFQVPAPVGAASSVVQQIIRLHPRVVLLDVDLGANVERVRLVHGLGVAGLAVVALTETTELAMWGQCVAMGARKVVSKNAPLSDILLSIARIANGLPVMSVAERRALLAQWQHHVDAVHDLQDRLGRLTRREAEVLWMLMEGKQAADIARERFVAESTVRTQIKSVLSKLQVGSQITAVGLAHKAEWSPADIGGQPARGVSIPAQRRGAEGLRAQHLGQPLSPVESA